MTLIKVNDLQERQENLQLSQRINWVVAGVGLITSILLDIQTVKILGLAKEDVSPPYLPRLSIADTAFLKAPERSPPFRRPG
jgi:hypothetical protein